MRINLLRCRSFCSAYKGIFFEKHVSFSLSLSPSLSPFAKSFKFQKNVRNFALRRWTPEERRQFLLSPSRQPFFRKQPTRAHSVETAKIRAESDVRGKKSTRAAKKILWRKIARQQMGPDLKVFRPFINQPAFPIGGRR